MVPSLQGPLEQPQVSLGGSDRTQGVYHLNQLSLPPGCLDELEVAVTRGFSGTAVQRLSRVRVWEPPASYEKVRTFRQINRGIYLITTRIMIIMIIMIILGHLISLGQDPNRSLSCSVEILKSLRVRVPNGFQDVELIIGKLPSPKPLNP